MTQKGTEDATEIDLEETLDVTDDEATSQNESDPAVLLADAEDRAVKFQEESLRIRAEMDNLRKRLARDADKARRFALERFMSDLLPVIDSMEMGVKEAGSEAATLEKLLEGSELTLKMLKKVVADHGLGTIHPDGESFDPAHHEAVTMMPAEGLEPNTVVEVLQKGYVLNDRLVRPAMVVVSK